MKKRSWTAAALMTTAAVAVGAVAPAAASAATVKAPSAQDVQYLKMSATMDLEEIAAGAIAFKKGQYPATKAYGKRLATDHLKHYAQAAVLAKAYGITLPKTVPADAVAMLKAVAAKSGAAFDIAYLKMEVAGHFEAVTLGTKEIERGSNVRIVKNAEQTSPIIRYHLWRGQLDLRYDLWDQGR
jgi:putative membrane protein